MHIAVFKGSESLVILGGAGGIKDAGAGAVLKGAFRQTEGHLGVKKKKKVIAAPTGAVDPVAVPVEILKIAVVYSHQRSGHGSFSLTVLICYRLFYGLPEDMSRIWEIPLFYLQDDVVIYIHNKLECAQ